MITIEPSDDVQNEATALASSHPEQVQQVQTRNAIGGGGGAMLMVTLAGVAAPVVKAVLVEWIRAGRYKSVTVKGHKIIGHSAADIAKILASIESPGADRE